MIVVTMTDLLDRILEVEAEVVPDPPAPVFVYADGRLFIRQPDGTWREPGNWAIARPGVPTRKAT